MDEVTERQRRRLTVVSRYDAYVRVLRLSGANKEAQDVHQARRELARAIEHACVEDDTLLEDFRRAFAARPRP